MRTKLIIAGLVSAFTVSLIFSGCRGTSDGDVATEIPDSTYVAQGNRIAAATFDSLRTTLTKTISTAGIDSAIAVCREKAIPLTSVYADSVDIRRTALRYRNPVNRPDSLEESVLKKFEKNMAAGSASSPQALVVRNSLGEVHFFKPIITQPMCLNCHGTPGKQVGDSTLRRLKDLYPEDRALDFQAGDLRGAWHIVFRPKNTHTL